MALSLILWKKEARNGKDTEKEIQSKTKKWLRVESAVSGAAQPLCLIPAQIDAATIISLRSTLSGRFRYILFQLNSIATKFASRYILLNFQLTFVSLQFVPNLISSWVTFPSTVYTSKSYIISIHVKFECYCLHNLSFQSKIAYCLVWQGCCAQLQCRWGWTINR